MKIGLDFHGVIDAYPELFTGLTEKWVRKGHEIHILTGKEWIYTEAKIKKLNISYTHHFSIVDYHLKKGTKMVKRKSGWWMDEVVWDKSKGDYSKKNGITIHFDNDLEYAKWFPKNCNFILVRKKNFEDLITLLRNNLHI